MSLNGRIIGSVVCNRLSLHRLYSLPSSSEFLEKWSTSSPPRSILDDDEHPVDLSEDNDAVNRVRRNPTPLHRRKPSKIPTPAEFKTHRNAMQRDFPQGWNPPKKLSREAMDGLRELYHMDKEKFSTPVLAEKFRISPEAVRRILKSRWEQPEEKRRKLVAREKQHSTLTKLKERLKERMEANQILEAKLGRPNGAGPKDRFTFQ